MLGLAVSEHEERILHTPLRAALSCSVHSAISDPDPPTNFPPPKAVTPSPQPPLLDLVYRDAQRGGEKERERCDNTTYLVTLQPSPSAICRRPSIMAEFVRAQIFGTTFEITTRYGTSCAPPYGGRSSDC